MYETTVEVAAADSEATTPRCPSVPPPHRRGRVMLYAILIVAILAINATAFTVGLVYRWWTDTPPSLQVVAAIAQANLLIAVLPRQPWLVGLIGAVATRAPKSLPLAVRRRLAQYYHVGGAHIGAALSGTLWYLVYVILLWPALNDGVDAINDVSVILSTALFVLLVVICLLAAPGVRARYHELFEFSHRFGGWLVLILAWANTFVLAVVHTRVHDLSYGTAITSSPVFWILCISTACTVWPWLLLHRVPITVECPSDHVAIVRLHSKLTPPVGVTRAISRHPLQSWHPFACIPAVAGEDGYRMAISRVGEWTGRFIDDPPSHVWVRGLSVPGVANAKRLFSRVLYVTTGSGIGPALGHLLTDTQGSRLVWVTRTPQRTYGEALVNEITTAQPNALIWDTTAHGKPDVFAISYQAFVDSGADAVIVVSNRPVTAEVVDGFEQRGIPAFGPIWDS